MTGLGCAFLTERCTNKSVFPYLCDARELQLVCTYDHLTKVHTTMYLPTVHYIFCHKRVDVQLCGEVLMVVLWRWLLQLNSTVGLKQQ